MTGRPNRLKSGAVLENTSYTMEEGHGKSGVMLENSMEAAKVFLH